MAERTRATGAILLILLAFVCNALSGPPPVQVEIAPHLPNSKERRENTSSTLEPLEFQLAIHDPNVDPNHVDMFPNAENSDKTSPARTQDNRLSLSSVIWALEGDISSFN